MGSWRESDIESRIIDDDGCIPNNSHYPLIIYRNVLDSGQAARAEDAFQSLFARNDWRDAWVDGIYDFHHYHSTAHEVLGIARGWAGVQFGGPEGPVVKLSEGDAVLIPAGVGHCRIQADNLSVVGAYPNGQEWDMCRATREDRTKALRNLPSVTFPQADPIYGVDGPLARLWLVCAPC